MTTTVAAASASASSLLTFLLIGSVLFGLGFARAVWVRAKRDYLTTKAAVKPLRKALWQSIWQTIKIGAIVAIAGICLVAWVVSDARSKDTPVPAGVSSSPSPSKSHRR